MAHLEIAVQRATIEAPPEIRANRHEVEALRMDTLVDRLRALDEEALYLAGLLMYADGVPFGLESRLPAWHKSMSETLRAGLTASYHNDPDAFEQTS